MCTILGYFLHMMYGSWDIECGRQNFLSFWTIFCSLTLLSTQRIKILKNEKNTGDIIILYLCTKYHNHMLQCSWDRTSDRNNFHFSCWAIFCPFKVSEHPFKENKNALKIMQVLLYTYFYNISLNVLRPNFLNICSLPVSHFPNIWKIRVKVGPKTNYFFYFMSFCTDRIVVFNNFFSLTFSQPRDKQIRARDFLLFK